MDTITGKQIKRLREKLNLSQTAFAVKFDVGDNTISRWENDEACPRNPARTKLCELYESVFAAKEPTNGTPKVENVVGANLFGGAQAKGGRHKVSVGRVQEVLAGLDAHLLGQQAYTSSKFVAEQYKLDFVTFREALVVFLYSVGDMSCKRVAQSLAGHE